MNTSVGQPQEACVRDCFNTIAYFTLLGQVMTPTDVWRWLYKPVSAWSPDQVLIAVEHLHAQSRITVRDGRVVLSGHEAVFAASHDQFLDAYRKWKIVRRVAWLASWIPGVRLVAVGNTLAWEATRPESDIDLFVVAREGSLWFVRMLCVAPLILLRARPGVRKRDAIDFTFFVSDASLELADVMLQPDDPYFAYWFASLVPFVDDGVMAELWDTNPWIHETLPNATPVEVSWYRRLKHSRPKAAWLYRVLQSTRLLVLLDRVAKTLSMRKFPRVIKEQMNRSTRVVVTDAMLKFHTTDNRETIRDQWKQVCKSYETLS